MKDRFLQQRVAQIMGAKIAFSGQVKWRYIQDCRETDSAISNALFGKMPIEADAKEHKKRHPEGCLIFSLRELSDA